MVRSIALLLPLLVIPLTVIASDARVRLDVESARVELGNPLHATLFTRGINRKPTISDLKPLRQSFALADVSEVMVQGEDRRLSITLYPLQSGSLTVPALNIDGHRSEPFTVEVLPATSRGIPLNVTSGISITRPWVRQQVLVTIEVITPDRFASLDVDLPQYPGLEVITIPGERVRIVTEKGERTRLRAGYALFALTPGIQSVQLPPVRYRLEGGTRRLFYPPETHLDVRALPPYIPPTLPVGKVEITSQTETDSWLMPRELAFWHIGLKADAIPPQWLPSVQRMLVSTNDIKFMPAEIYRTATPTGSGVHASNDYRIPFRPISQGWSVLPTLAVDYFDPARGMLKRAVLQPRHILVVGNTVRFILLVLALTLLALKVKKVFLRFLALWRKFRACSIAISYLEGADDANAVRAALRCYASAGSINHNLSLLEVQRKIGQGISDSDIKQLQELSYSSEQEGDFQALRQRFIEALRSQRLQFARKQ